ncbi:MAG: 3-oxoacyl-ACP reductase FabG [Chloroflexi bacterium]|nr:3-oxoacyl-ACP reductase FabG [Chloroflexota bacterium]
MPVPYRFKGLEGKLAVVTGGSQNLGAAMAEALGEQGCKVAVIGRRNREGAEAVAARIRSAGGTAQAWCTDLTRQDMVIGLFREIEASLGLVEVLVNNAGGRRHRATFLNRQLLDWREVFLDNVDTTFLCSKAVVGGMIEQRWGRIVNISSMAGVHASPGGDPAYAAAKAAVIGLTRQMAIELGPHGITVNAVAPGTTFKEMGRSRRPEQYEEMAARVTLRRLGLPGDQAAAVCFLASPASEWITGETIEIDGGGMP